MGGKILVLEDSPMMRSLYAMVLSDHAELVFAEDGIEALDRAAAQPDISLFIVDVNLPRMDGLEFIRRLRTDLGVKDLPVVVVSTECEAEDREAAYRAGANAYLCKPWSPPELNAVLRDVQSPGAAGEAGRG